MEDFINPYNHMLYQQALPRDPPDLPSLIKTGGNEERCLEKCAAYLINLNTNDKEGLIKEVARLISAIQEQVDNESKYKNPAHVIRMLQHKIIEKQPVSVHYDVLLNCLKEAAWPNKDDDVALFRAGIEGVVGKEWELSGMFNNPMEFESAMIRAYEERMLHQKGFVPEWLVRKRQTPSTDIGMLRSQQKPYESFPIKPFIQGEDYPKPHRAQGGLGGKGAKKDFLTDHDLSSIFNKLAQKGVVKHSVGLEKGGLTGMLDIFIDGFLCTKWTGPFTKSEVNVGIGESSHKFGPWYALMRDPPPQVLKSEHYEIPIDQIEVFLVQKPEDKAYLLHVLENAVDRKFISFDRKEEIASKIKTYKEYNEAL